MLTVRALLRWKFCLNRRKNLRVEASCPNDDIRFRQYLRVPLIQNYALVPLTGSVGGSHPFGFLRLLNLVFLYRFLLWFASLPRCRSGLSGRRSYCAHTCSRFSVQIEIPI